MKYFFIIVLFLLSGCASSNANLLLNTGKKPPTFFTITDKKTMDDFVFDTQKFSFNFLSSKPSDFTNMGGWEGESMRDGNTIALGFKNSTVYQTTVSTSGNTLEYGERERAAEYKNYQYLKAHIKYGKNKYGREGNINVHYETHGKENYSCMVKEARDKRYGKRKIGYHCYKFNPSRTLVNGVTVVLTYNKPKNPTLAKQYTYKDLQNRAKRMLDSLYIKDGW